MVYRALMVSTVGARVVGLTALSRVASRCLGPLWRNPTPLLCLLVAVSRDVPVVRWIMGEKVIDALVDHFMTFTSEKRVLPVLWHQSLLVFAQRYRGDITRADKDRLKEVRSP